jgi:uncharacterized membrane protein YecN with MAPEG domain
VIFPYVSATTAGLILILQMLLAFTVSGARGRSETWVGDGGHDDLMRIARRHANLAENSGIFIAGFILLELSGWQPIVLLILCPAFVIVRLAHVAGLSAVNTKNPLRLIGGVGTYLIGLVLGGCLLWISGAMALSRY